jgi:CHASE3 domain sensor protein
MSEDQQQSFMAEFKRQVIGVFLFTLVSISGIGIAFYFTTNSTFAQMEMKQNMYQVRQTGLENEVELLNEKKIEKADYFREIDEVKVMIKDLGRKIDNIK